MKHYLNCIRNFFSILFFGVFVATSAQGQTNDYYKVGDLTFSLAPTASLPASAASLKGTVYGVSLETTYWQTDHTGTGLEIGKREFKGNTTSGIDHIAAIEAFRIVPAPNTPLFNRLSLNMFTGAETWLNTGAKGLELGVGSEFACTVNFRLFSEASQHFESTAEQSGLEFVAGLRWRF